MTEHSEEKRPALDCPFEKVHPSELHRDDTYYMWHAYNEAINAWKEDEVPVGAVIVHEGQIIAKAYNRRDRLKDPTAHAEILAITQASEAIDNWRLNACTLYVSKEPCPMCSGAVIMSRIGRIVYALGDPKMGCLGGVTNLGTITTMNHHPEIIQGILADECQALFQAYFKLKRIKTAT
mgnify:CR=1 FL=1